MSIHPGLSKFEITRARLIDSAAQLLAEGCPLSIDSVAEAAGLSHGAVRHHFGSREALLMAMYETYMAQFEQSAHERDTATPVALSYADAALFPPTEGMPAYYRQALLVCGVVDRAVAARWSEWVATDRAREEEDSAEQLLVRLAADGLWLSNVLETYKISERQRAELRVLFSEMLARSRPFSGS